MSTLTIPTFRLSRHHSPQTLVFSIIVTIHSSFFSNIICIYMYCYSLICLLKENFYSTSSSLSLVNSSGITDSSVNTNNTSINNSSSTSDENVNRQLSYKDAVADVSTSSTGVDEKQDRLKEIESIFAPASSASLSDEKKNSSRYKRRSRTCFTKYQVLI